MVRPGLNWTRPRAGVNGVPTECVPDGGLLANWSLDLVGECPLSAFPFVGHWGMGMVPHRCLGPVDGTTAVPRVSSRVLPRHQLTR